MTLRICSISLPVNWPTSAHCPGLWGVLTDADGLFHVYPNGQLVRVDERSGTRWTSGDLVGAFTISSMQGAAAAPVHTALVENGFVISVRPTPHAITRPLITAEGKWQLKGLPARRSSLCGSLEEAVALILEAEHNPQYRTDDPVLDAMLALALCRPSLLSGTQAREAMQLLEPHHLKAIVTWSAHRAGDDDH